MPPRRCRWLLPVAFLSLLAGCGGASSSASSTSGGGASTTVGSVPTSGSSGCGKTAHPGTTTVTPTIGGRARIAIVHVPESYRASTPVPLVLNLHGSQSTALAQEGFTGMNATSDANGFIVVYPQGDIPAGSGFEWNVPGQPLFGGAAVPADAPDDVVFLEQLVDLMEHTYCVDHSRVYVTGFSGGARMASQLGCDASGTFAAIAPVSGLRFPSPCPSIRAVPVLSFHGSADPVDPIAGNGQAYWTYSVAVAAQRWAAHDGCAPTPTVSSPVAGVTETTYGRCTGGATVQLSVIEGEGHEWPGGPHLPKAATRLLGPQSSAIDADAAIWAFFAAHPLA